ncbi:hypothetical protein LBMAG40_02830 [Cyanobium sp.]|nr:hypothetical protein LBMAG40_02830 [Cyanobium sp.]
MSKHEEFPELTPEAKAAWNAACIAGNVSLCSYSHISTRRFFAAFLREAMKQAHDHYGFDAQIVVLKAIANNLHNPPLPPSLAQARAADLDTPEGKAVVRDFLATLGEGVRL